MYIILYNPLSSNNNGHNTVKGVIEMMEEQKVAYHLRNLLSISNPKKFISELKKDDKIIVAGGDGTLSRSFAYLKNERLANEIFMYPAGTGNDFLRNFTTSKNIKKKMLCPLDKSFFLPEANFDGEKYNFINGCGVGIDGEVSFQTSLQKNKNKLTYMMNALKNFLTYKPIDAKITIDGTVYDFTNTWIVAVQNGKYFGGGMTIAPEADIMVDELDVCVVHSVPRWKLFQIFPSIYSGKHIKYEKYVFMAKAKTVKVELVKPTYGQVDGEIPLGKKLTLTVNVKDRVILSDEQV